MSALRQHFVAIATRAFEIATFVPYSQHFVAIAPTVVGIATKRLLPHRPTQRS